MTSDCTPEVIKADDVARMLGVSKQTVYSAARDGELPCRRVGRRYVFVKQVIQDWMLMKQS